MYASKAAQKQDLDALSKQYESIREKMSNKCLEDRKNYGDLYWEIPLYLHHWSPKRIDQFTPRFFDEVVEIESLLERRNDIKGAPICKPAPVTKREEKITNKVKDILQKRKLSYMKGLKMAEAFGFLNVSVNAHLVTNQQGTTFLRCFWFMNGKFTALNTILAVYDKAKRDGFLK